MRRSHMSNHTYTIYILSGTTYTTACDFRNAQPLASRFWGRRVCQWLGAIAGPLVIDNINQEYTETDSCVSGVQTKLNIEIRLHRACTRISILRFVCTVISILIFACTFCGASFVHLTRARIYISIVAWPRWWAPWGPLAASMGTYGPI